MSEGDPIGSLEDQAHLGAQEEATGRQASVGKNQRLDQTPRCRQIGGGWVNLLTRGDSRSDCPVVGELL